MPLGKPHIINLTTYQIYEEKYYMGNSIVVVSTLQQQSEFWTQGRASKKRVSKTFENFYFY
jgi:hypothetical protein